MRDLRKKENYIYLLPNLFTTGNLFCGFYSIVASLKGFYIRAALAIIIAGIFDIFDGRLARLTKGYSRFGEEYDSLADLVSFGIAPSILMYLWGLSYFGRVGWLAAFLFIACGALRLARFNIQSKTTEKSFFQGLPIPIAAGVIASAILLAHELKLMETKNYYLLGLTFLLAYLMVSNIRYKNFKELNLHQRRSLGLLVIGIILLIIIASNPEVMLFVLYFSYTVTGIVVTLFSKKKKRLGVRNYSQQRLVELIERKEEAKNG